MSRQDRPLPYHGVYINLDRSVERRVRLEAQLVEFGLKDRYARFPAVDGTALGQASTNLRPGERGAFLSHCKALSEARARGGCVHIMEDDALLSEHVRPVIEEAISSNLFERYDLIFTDMMVNCHLGMLKFLRSAFAALALPRQGSLRLQDLQLVDLEQQNFACLTS